jgi:hypothetical protein
MISAQDDALMVMALRIMRVSKSTLLISKDNAALPTASNNGQISMCIKRLRRACCLGRWKPIISLTPNRGSTAAADGRRHSSHRPAL